MISTAVHILFIIANTSRRIGAALYLSARIEYDVAQAPTNEVAYAEAILIPNT